MAFEQRPNAGAMFISKNKKTDTSPDFYGSVHVDKVLLENLINKQKGGLVEISLAGWNKKSVSGNVYLSLAASEPYKTEAKSNDDDVPEFMRG